MIEGLYVLNLDEQNIARLCPLDIEGTREVVNTTEIDIFHIICTVIVLDLPAGPVEALDLDSLAISDRGRRWDCMA